MLREGGGRGRGGGLGKGKGKGVWVCRVGQGKERDLVGFSVGGWVGGSIFERGVLSVCVVESSGVLVPRMLCHLKDGKYVPIDLSLSLSASVSVCVCLSLSLCYAHTHTHSLSLPPSLSLSMARCFVEPSHKRVVCAFLYIKSTYSVAWKSSVEQKLCIVRYVSGALLALDGRKE